MSEFPTVTPVLVVREADPLITIIEQAFGGRTRCRLVRTDGSVMHAEIEIGDSVVMVGEPPVGFEPSVGHIYLRVDDADEAYSRAMKAGGESFFKPATREFSLQRYGGIIDPCGNYWCPAVEVESVSPEEEQRRINAMGDTNVI